MDALRNLDATIIAGGTDVMVEVTHGLRALGDVVAVRRVAELTRIRVNSAEIRVGAAVPYADLTGPAGVAREAAPVLWSAAATMGSTQIRGAGTLGGNVATASPVGDSLCALLALDARATIASGPGTRVVTVADLLAEGGGSGLAKGELLVDFHWAPATGPQAFLKVCRRGAVSRSVVSVAISLPADGRPRIVVGGCGPRPLRVAAAELLASTGAVGQLLDHDLSSAVAEAVRSALSPVDDVAASAAYRRHVAGVLVRRALTLPAERRAA